MGPGAFKAIDAGRRRPNGASSLASLADHTQPGMRSTSPFLQCRAYRLDEPPLLLFRRAPTKSI